MGSAAWHERFIETVRGLGPRRTVARITGVSESQIYRYLDGSDVPRWDFVIAIATAAGVSLDWLAGCDGLRVHVEPRADQAAPPTALNVTLLSALVAGAEVVSDERGAMTPPERAQMIARMYAALSQELPPKTEGEVPHG